MDANQVGFVHELEWNEFRRSSTIRWRSAATPDERPVFGGEPTLSPFFLRAIQYAKDVGFFCVQCATNGIRSQDPGFASKAQGGRLRIAYLQFDGVGEEANAHRKVGNLFDVKLRAIENLHAAGSTWSSSSRS